MLRTLARVLGIIVAILAVAGFFVEGDHLLGFMNVDIVLDVLRVIIAVALLYVGFGKTTESALRIVLGVVGGMYVLMGIIAIFDRTILGLLPTGFTVFDIIFHLVVGLGSLIAAIFLTETRSGKPRLDAQR
jgi:hypothetical protein